MFDYADTASWRVEVFLINTKNIFKTLPFTIFFTHIYSFKPQKTAKSLVFNINLILRKE